MRTLSYNTNCTVTYTDDLNFIQVRRGDAMYIIKNGEIASKCGIKDRNEVGFEHIECKEYIQTEEKIEEKILKEGDKDISDEDYLRINCWSQTSNYDGSEYQAIYEEKDTTCKMYKFGSIRAFDTKLRQKKGKGLIQLIDLLTYMSTIHEFRELIYNNKWGISVSNPRMQKFPEFIMIETIAKLMLEAIHLEDHSYMRNKFMLIWSSAPEDSIAGKAWNTFPSLEYDDMDRVIAWQNGRDSFKPVTEEEVAADKMEWTYEWNEYKKYLATNRKHQAMYEFGDIYDNGSSIIYK